MVVVGGGIVARRVLKLLDARSPFAVDRVDQLPDELGAGALVILAGGGAHAGPAADLAALGVSVVSVADALDDVSELMALHDRFASTGATVVPGAGMSPGLSGLFARHLSLGLARCDEIHVAVHATAGPACARQHHRALAGRAVGWHDGRWIERPAGSGRELCWFPEPVGAHDCYRAELADPVLLHDGFPEVERISARVSATRRDRLTARLPMLRPPHVEGGIGALRVEVRGLDRDGHRVAAIAGVAEYVGAAAGATAVAMASLAIDGRLPSGLVTTCSPEIDVHEVLGMVARGGVRLQEFTGVPQRG